MQLLHPLAMAQSGLKAVGCNIAQDCAGDFHQLPPVAKGKEAAADRKFAFEAATWRSCVDHCAQLTHVFRQVRSHLRRECSMSCQCVSAAVCPVVHQGDVADSS